MILEVVSQRQCNVQPHSPWKSWSWFPNHSMTIQPWSLRPQPLKILEVASQPWGEGLAITSHDAAGGPHQTTEWRFSHTLLQCCRCFPNLSELLTSAHEDSGPFATSVNIQPQSMKMLEVLSEPVWRFNHIPWRGVFPTTESSPPPQCYWSFHNCSFKVRPHPLMMLEVLSQTQCESSLTAHEDPWSGSQP